MSESQVREELSRAKSENQALAEQMAVMSNDISRRVGEMARAWSEARRNFSIRRSRCPRRTCEYQLLLTLARLMSLQFGTQQLESNWRDWLITKLRCGARRAIARLVSCYCDVIAMRGWADKSFQKVPRSKGGLR